jgi:two-component system nitrate/nitrite response regulator NarL
LSRKADRRATKEFVAADRFEVAHSVGALRIDSQLVGSAMPELTSNRPVEGGFDIVDARGDVAPPRVYVVSDVRLYREGLISTLAAQRGLTAVGAGSSEDVLDRVSALRPDVLLLDLAARESLAIPRRARQACPTLRIVALAVAEVAESVLACAEAGISGYVTQDGSAEDLVAAVLGVMKGELECSPRMAAALFSRLASLSDGGSAPSIHSGLTPREQEIASLLACHLPNKEIARKLRLGPATVKNHVHNILQKLNAHRRSDLAGLRLKADGWRIAPTARTVKWLPPLSRPQARLSSPPASVAMPSAVAPPASAAHPDPRLDQI